MSSLPSRLANFASRFIPKQMRFGRAPESNVLKALSPSYTGRGASMRQVLAEAPQGEDLVRRIMGWTFVCLTINARAYASVPLRLYSTAGPKATRAFRTRCIDDNSDNYDIRAQWANLRDCNRSPQTREIIERAVFDGQIVEEIVEGHPWNRLMRLPNPVLEWCDILELTSMYRQSVGDAHWFIAKDGMGVPTGIWPLPSHRMVLVRGTENQSSPVAGWILKGATLNLTFPDEAQQGKIAIQLSGGATSHDSVFVPEDIVHFRQVNPLDPYGRGMSAIRAGRLCIDLEVLMEEYQRQLLEGDGTPTWLMYTEQRMGPDFYREFLERWKTQRDEYGPGMPGILEAGMKPHVLGLTPREMAFVQGQEVLLREIAAVLGVPISFLDTKNVNKANDEASEYRHAKKTIKPLCLTTETEINRSIIWPCYGEEFFVAFDNCVPEDAAELREEIRMGLTNPLLTPNEGRKRKRLPPLAIAGMDETWTQGAMIPTSIAAKGPQKATTSGGFSKEGGQAENPSDDAPTNK